MVYFNGGNPTVPIEYIKPTVFPSPSNTGH